MEFYQNHSVVFVQAVALWIWFSVLGNYRRSAKNRIFHWTNVSLTYQLINRSTIWKILLKFGCPERFVGLIPSFHNRMKDRVSFNGTLSEEISINNVMKWGDISAPMLFNIYFPQCLLWKLYIRYRTSGSVFNVRGLLSQRKVSSVLRELLNADDCDIVAHSEDELQCFMNHFVSACNSFGLKINLKWQLSCTIQHWKGVSVFFST